jgi:hypothetical protein
MTVTTRPGPVLLALALALAAACGRTAAPPAAASTAPTASTASTASSAAATPPPAERLTLIERLTREATQRPAARPRVEEVLAALGTRGIATAGWKQVLASPVGARYCMAGQTAGGVGLAVCEYESPAAAAAGRDRSHALFDRLIPNRLLTVNRTTLLTLTRPTAEPALASEAERVRTLFTSL